MDSLSLSLPLNAMWHWHNGRRKKSRERENEGKERVERVRQTAERETCKFGGHESLHLLKDFDPNDGIEGEDKEHMLSPSISCSCCGRRSVAASAAEPLISAAI